MGRVRDVGVLHSRELIKDNYNMHHLHTELKTLS